MRVKAKEHFRWSGNRPPIPNVPGLEGIHSGRDRAIHILRGDLEQRYITTMFTWADTTNSEYWMLFHDGIYKIDGEFHQNLCDLIMEHPEG